MKKLIIREEVFADVEETWCYYESIIPGLGDQFLDDWDTMLSYVEKHPEHFAKKKKDIRCARLKRFPFIICFVIEAKLILVYRLIHVKKTPAKRYRQ